MKRSLLIVTLVVLAGMLLSTSSFAWYSFTAYLERGESVTDNPTMSNSGTDCLSLIDTYGLSGDQDAVEAFTRVQVIGPDFDAVHTVRAYDVSQEADIDDVPWDTGTAIRNVVHHALVEPGQEAILTGEAYFKFQDPNN